MVVTEFTAAFILALVQGITEWLPISSSGHLVVFEHILEFSGGLQYEVALHFGTLMAVFVYFGKDITEIIRAFFTGAWSSEEGKIGLYLIIASIPAALVGFLVAPYFDALLTNLRVVALGFGITGIFLFIASMDHTTKKPLSYKRAFIIGIAQAFAILPGVSRSGATMATGVLLGLSEKTAMRFSFLMFIPVIFGASIFTIGNNPLPTGLIWATLVSFIVGLCAIHLLFTKLLTNKKNFRWFGTYCVLLALGLLILTLL